MARKPRALVFRATSPLGNAVVRELASRGWTIAAATENVLGGAMLALLGATVIQLDLRDGDAVMRQAEGADAVFFDLPPTPLGSAARGLARLAISAIVRAPRPQVILAGSGPIADKKARRDAPIMMDAMDEAIRQLTPLPPSWNMVLPGMFIEDVLRVSPLEEIQRDGVVRYPLPAEIKVRWTSAGRVAATVADTFEAALADEETEPAIMPAMTLPLDGARLAAAIGKTIGLPEGIEARYEAITPESAVEAMMERETIDDDLADALVDWYGYLAENPELLAPDEAPSTPMKRLLSDVLGA
jgi:uncharacterized protein YbjT (DUF2867 family)